MEIEAIPKDEPMPPPNGFQLYLLEAGVPYGPEDKYAQILRKYLVTWDRLRTSERQMYHDRAKPLEIAYRTRQNTPTSARPETKETFAANDYRLQRKKVLVASIPVARKGESMWSPTIQTISPKSVHASDGYKEEVNPSGMEELYLEALSKRNERGVSGNIDASVASNLAKIWKDGLQCNGAAQQQQQQQSSEKEPSKTEKVLREVLGGVSSKKAPRQDRWGNPPDRSQWKRLEKVENRGREGNGKTGGSKFPFSKPAATMWKGSTSVRKGTQHHWMKRGKKNK
ncbi:hypothetical protein BDR26DRAFT_862848 [Obelidium mucronatum]|nr:hypothetical protein BDR26DRAFT_862848 [Obelidium mucronatum]